MMSPPLSTMLWSRPPLEPMSRVHRPNPAMSSIRCSRAVGICARSRTTLSSRFEMCTVGSSALSSKTGMRPT